MRFLFVVFPEAGHFNPFVGIAQHLTGAGHTVEFFSMEDLEPRLAAAGVPARCQFVTSSSGGERRTTRARDLGRLLARPAFARRWYEYVLVSQVRAQVAGLRELVSARRPDVLVTDPLAYAGAIVAEQEGLRWAALSTQLLALAPAGWTCPYLDCLAALASDRERLFAAEKVSIAIRAGEVVSPWLNTVFATEDLAPRPADNPHTVYVGPARSRGPRGDEPSDFPWQRLRDDRPLVYISFGSQLGVPPDLYEWLVSAVDADEAQLVVTFPDAEDRPPATPPHVIAVHRAPQLALLDRAALMVSHGGANSTAECLARGKPMLVVPVIADQPLQALLVERRGAGFALTLEAATAPRVREAVRGLLSDQTFRKRAAEIGRAYSAADGSAAAAELLLKLGTQ
jgi:UDP:flavonoid glycosyltransferase YjiC (YdhE family)